MSVYLNDGTVAIFRATSAFECSAPVASVTTELLIWEESEMNQVTVAKKKAEQTETDKSTWARDKLTLE